MCIRPIRSCHVPSCSANLHFSAAVLFHFIVCICIMNVSIISNTSSCYKLDHVCLRGRDIISRVPSMSTGGHESCSSQAANAYAAEFIYNIIRYRR